jgi:ABC-type lipoprotein release transport system permease subunit
MWAWTAAGRSSVALSDFLRRADVPDVAVAVCPPGHDPATGFEPCVAPDQPDALETIRNLPSVASTSRGGWVHLRVASDRHPDDSTVLALFALFDDASFPTIYGQPVVVSGRLAAPDAPDEIVISEIGAEVLGVGPGSKLILRDVDRTDEPGNGAAAFTSTVTGVVRTVADLLPTKPEYVRGLGLPQLWAGPGWTAAHHRQVGDEGGGFAVALREHDVDQFQSELEAAFPDRIVNVSPVFSTGELLTLRQATRYEARVGVVVAAFASVACALFVVQAVARQTRKECAESDVLNALGATDDQVRRAAIVRWSPVAVSAGLVAVVATALGSMAGPVGLARRSPWDPGVAVDAIVVVTGLVATVLAVVAGAVVGSHRRHEVRNPSSAPRLAGPPPAATGVALLLRSARHGAAASVVTAIAGTAAAIAVLVASSGLVLTIDRVTKETDRFGATWDALVGAPNSDQQAVEATLTATPGVEGGAWLLGTTVEAPSGEELWVQTLRPIPGLAEIEPGITSGIVPTGDDQIALGSVALAREGLRVGDHIDLVPAGQTSAARFTIVGSALVSDGFEPNVGLGGFITPEGLERLEPGATGSAVVRVASGSGRDAALANLRARFPDTFVPTSVPSTIQNLDRLSPLPVLLAVVAATLAAVTIAHALLISVRRQRRDLAVCKAIGFTRGQLSLCVATEASTVATAALLLGLPVGILATNRVWLIVADGLGLATSAVVSLTVVVATALAVLLVANAAAAVPGSRARRIRPAEALRAE